MNLRGAKGRKFVIDEKLRGRKAKPSFNIMETDVHQQDFRLRAND